MSKFIRDVLIFCAINLSVLGYLFVIYDFDADYLASLNDKLDRLESTEPPRILFIGGSSVAWSNHTQLVKDAFGMDAENMAIHAGMALSMRINEARMWPRQGDIVVLSIEWSNYTDVPWTRKMAEVVIACPRMFLLMGSRDRKLVADGLLPAMRIPFTAFFDDFKKNKLKAFTHASAQKRKQWRLRENFSDLGDFQGHYGVKPFGIAGRDVVFSSMEELEEGIERLNELIAELRDRGVEVYYFVPVIPQSRFDAKRETALAHVQKLVDELDAPVLNPDNFVFPDDAYFDSCFHLQDVPGQERTQILVDELSKYLKPQSQSQPPSGDSP